jgi:hypothetical protein
MRLRTSSGATIPSGSADGGGDGDDDELLDGLENVRLDVGDDEGLLTSGRSSVDIGERHTLCSCKLCPEELPRRGKGELPGSMVTLPADPTARVSRNSTEVEAESTHEATWQQIISALV